MKVALVYDRVNKWGGAERVLLALNKLFPKAPLYTSVYDQKKASWAEVFPKVIPSFLQKLPFATRHELYASIMPLAFESFNFDEYDLIISLTSESANGIITKPKTAHICYCLTPTRYLWSGYEDYFKDKALRLFSKPVVSYLRSWDKKVAHRPDTYIAISKEVQRRIKKYYGKESTVIYPPIVLDNGKTLMGNAASFGYVKRRTLNDTGIVTAKRKTQNDYFLIVSRLVPYKRIDLAVEAFNMLGWKLKIIGTGSEEKRLKAMAKENIEFLGSLTDEELMGYYKNCLALVFPGSEDFGLTILEAQSFGKPVIAFRGGGALETIIEGKSGEFFETEESLLEILKNFNKNKYKSEDCIKNTERFSFDRFKKELNGYIAAWFK